MINGVEYNTVGRLFEAVWGIKPVFNAPVPPSIRQMEQWMGINSFQASVVDKTEESENNSWMGTPIVHPVFFQGGTYKTYDLVSGELKDVRMGEFQLPAATLVDVSRAKTIVKTAVNGGDGAVKELYSFDDWSIKIRGICLDDIVFSDGSVRKTVDQKAALEAWERIAGAIGVEGYAFRGNNIRNLVIENITFRQVEGRPNMIPFEIDAVSDEPAELTINSGTLKRRS